MKYGELKQELQRLKLKATEGPVFVNHDSAEDTKDHAHSGLAMIDTGRSMDWPVLRLGEWPTTEFIACLYNNIEELLAALDEAEQAQCRISDLEYTLGEAMNEYMTDPLALAVLFHVTYERLSAEFSYQTREETRIFDPESPNGKLMVATCREVQRVITEEGRPTHEN